MGLFVNHSQKRDAILACLRSTDTHPTAEWIYQRLKPAYPDLSLGTVYRNLSRLKAAGVITSVGTVGGLERFEGNLSPHAHFICSSCRAVIDTQRIALDPKLLEEVCAKTGASVTSYQVRFSGLCPDCMKKQNENTMEEHK